MKSLDTIKDILHYLSEKDVIHYLSAIYSFFFTPKKFWTEFNSLSGKQKFWQLITYCAIIVIVVFCLSNTDFKTQKIGEFLFTETGSLLPIWLVSTSILFAYFGFRRLPQAAGKAFFISLYTKALFCSFQSVFLKLYGDTDSFIYLFVATVISIAAELYFLYVSIYAIHPVVVKKKLWIGLATGLICFALVDASHFLLKTSSSKGEANFANTVVDEREDKLDGLFTNFLIPHAVAVTDSIPFLFYLYSMPTDTTLYRINIDENAYIQNIQNDISIIENKLPSIRHKANIKYAKDLLEIKKAIVYTHQNKSYSGEIKCHVTINRDSTNWGYTLAAYNDKIWEDNLKLMKSYCWLYCQYDLAMSPTILQFIYRPFLIVPYLKDSRKALRRDRTINAWDGYIKLCQHKHTYTIQHK